MENDDEKTPRILVVEDTLSLCEVVHDYLELQGYVVDTASEGLEGLNLIEKNEYDLVLTDLCMPGVDGFAIIERANERFPDIPKIIMTGFSEVEDVVRALKLGTYDFLRKPIPRLEELGLVITRALDHLRLKREQEMNQKRIEEMNQQLIELNEHLEDEVSHRTEELQEANSQLITLDEMKNNLLANVSHELRTPLVSVRGYTELFYHGHMGTLPEGSVKYLDTCLRNIDKLLTLIDSLVRYAEIVRTQEPLTLSQVNLNRLILKVADDFQEKYAEKSSILKVDIPDEEFVVNADAGNLALVFEHLLDNALKFNPEGTVVRFILERSGKKLAKISVSDNGQGIPSDQQAKVFDRFYQCDSSPTRKHGGTGIGLAIVRDNMRLMGCEVRVSSELGQGTTFYWTMPIVIEQTKKGEK